jgi:hypothetical protein
MGLNVGVAWSTYFERRGFQRLQYRRLRYAYRAPSYFLQGMLARDDHPAFLEFDEDLTGADLSGFNASSAQLDILYVASHGMTTSSGYEVALNASDWAMMTSEFGKTGPKVVIFDTCDLVDTSSPNWINNWRTSSIGPALRLVLGFSSLATVSQRSSIRGLAFAEEMARRPLAEAWYASIQETSYIGTDHPIAIALGDDDQDARRVLEETTIDDLPGPRTKSTLGVDWGPKK